MPTLKARLRICVLIVVFWASFSHAQSAVRKINEFTFAPRQNAWTLRDLFGHFAEFSTAVSTDGALFVFQASPRGVWRLTRIRNWQTEKPEISLLELPGFYTIKDGKDLEELTVKISLDHDQRSAVCIGSGWWNKRVHGKSIGIAHASSRISIVDIASMKISRQFDTSMLEASEFESVHLDKADRISLQRKTTLEQASEKIVTLMLPNFDFGPTCDYVATGNNLYTEQTPESCKVLLRGEDLSSYIYKPFRSAPGQYSCLAPKLDYCPQPDVFTPDRKFALGIATEGHDNFFGSWVETGSQAVLFSADTKAEIGRVDLHPAYGVPLITSIDGDEYLLVINQASSISIYKIT
jgi:hypothetical protein